MDISQFSSRGNIFLKKIKLKSELIEEKVDGYFIDSEEKEVRRIIDTLKGKKEKKIIAVMGRDEEFNRRVLETCKISLLVSPERLGKDSLKQRGSGLNHVLAKIAAKNNISIVINFSSIPEDKKQRALTLSRIIQNIKVCRKANCKIKIATFAETDEQLRNERELKSFLFSLGASSQQVSEACEF